MENLLTTDVAEIQLHYKTKVKASDRPKISGSKDAYDLLIKRWNPSKIEFIEEFKMLLLNRASRLLGYVELSSGGTTSTIVDPKLIFVAAIKANACGIILCHNHPSGILNPSQADIQLTRKIKDGANLFGITLLDHIIVNKVGYLSFADEGML